MKVLLHTLFILFISMGALSAQTVWTGNIDSDWENAGNWSSGIPTSGMTITIPGTPAGGNFPVFSGGPVLDYNIQIAGTITFNTLIYNNGDIINFVGGSIITNGAFFNSGGGTIDNDGFFTNNGTFTNYGSFDSALSGETTNAAGATFTHAGLFFKSAGPFINNGAVENTSNMRVTNLFENNGTIVNYNSFEAPFGSTFNNHVGASIDNPAGSIFVVNGAFTNDAPINNAGEFSIQSATIGVNNSTITSTGLLEVAGALTNDGTILNNDVLNITDGGTLTNNSVLTNNGSINLSICGTLVQNSGGNIVAPVLSDGLIFLLNGTVDWTNIEFGNEFTDLSNTKPPVAGCRAGVTVTLDETGNAALTAAEVDKGSYGSCGAGLASVTIDRTDFTTADLGAQTVTMTVTDNLGVVSTCDAVVLVLPYIPPVVPTDDPDIDFACPADLTVTALPGAGFAEATWPAPTATSTCSSGGPNNNQVQIIARGQDGRETMKLRIAGTVVKAWENIGTAFTTFTYTHTSPVTANDIRVRFTNDFYDATAGVDYNLIVDKIVLGGVEYETEHPTVVSKGNANNCSIIANYENEKLACNGYFQYDNNGGSGLVPCASAPVSHPNFIFLGEYNDAKYFVSDHPATWLTASANANAIGGHLTTINDAAENAFINNAINPASGSVWTGLNTYSSAGVFAWENGDAVAYTNWQAGEPNGSGVEYGARMKKSTGEWTDQPNHVSFEYVVEVPCSAAPTCMDVNLNFVFDNYPEDISWDVRNDLGTVVASGGNYGAEPDGSSLTESFCLTDGCYDFNIYDSYGDGLCCAYGNGSYAVVDTDGNVLASGGSFTSLETSNFCISTSNPTGGDPVVTQIRGAQSGQNFSIGTTEIAYEVTDPCGNVEICIFDVTVDATPSEITLIDCPTDITVDTDPGATSAVIDWTAPTGSTTCWNGGLEIKQALGPDKGSVLRVKDGAQLIAYNAIDSCGNFSSCVFTVTVVATPSTITMAACPNDILIVPTPGQTEAVATWTAPTATTTCFTGNTNIQQLDGPASGSTFQVGTTTRIIYIISDDCGNTEICIFFVVIDQCPAAGTTCDDGDPKTINDVEDGNCNCAGTLTTLSINCPADLVINALPGATDAVATWADATASSDCNVGAVAVSQTAGPANGDVLPLGTTTITYEATDGCTNATSCSFTVTVNATNATLTLVCPSDITVAAAPGDLTAPVSWIAPVPTSDCVIQPVNLIQSAGPANGASFLEGTTTVTYTATDGCGETETCSFTVTVTTSCVDADGDGVCAADDCDDNDANLPAAVGSTCDDADPTTENDVILADGCSCAGTPIVVDPCEALGGDADGDGVCAADDCDDNDANLPAAVGSTCDDADPTTENDVILADGCSCAGTPITTGPDCADIVVTPGASSITISGLTGAPITTIQIFNAVWQEVFNCAGNCDPNEQVVTGLLPGVHFVKVGFYNASWSPICSIEDYYTVTAGDPCEALGGDADGDGVCAADDCDDNDANVPAPVGSTCDDGDATTNNDVILTDACTCAGTPIGGDPCDNFGGDADGDGVCALDDCDDNDANLPAAVGSTCDDGDATTENDAYLADGCTCAGTPIVTGPDCANISITPGDGFITVSGLNGAPISTLQVFNNVWTEVYNCAGNCNDTEVITGLTDGAYFVKAVYYTAGWAPICSVEDFYTVVTGVGGDPCDNLGGDADGDGVCALNDCDDNDANLPAPVGTSCDDGDPLTLNDEIQADGCSCAGTIPGTGPDCNNITVTVLGDAIIVGGLSDAPITSVQIFDPVWSEVFNCAGNCDPNEVSVTGLTDGTYFVKVGFYDATWSPVCSIEDYYTIISSGEPLLRKIVNFEAEKGARQVDLTWGTNTGSINDHFEIERSADGINYETLLIKGNKFTGMGTYVYEDEDRNPLAGWNYYRLKQVHVDGTYVITAERRVLFEDNLSELTVFPNPVEDQVFVHMDAFVGKAVSVELYNNLGQLVQNRQLESADSAAIGVDVSDLQAGVYSISVKIEGRKRVTKLLVVARR